MATELPPINPLEAFIAQAKLITSKTEPMRWHGYASAVRHAELLEPHVFGAIPKEIIEKSRPNEPKEITDYRQATWEAVTKTRFAKIMTVLKRIFNPSNYTISYKERPAGVKETADPAKYFTREFGEMGSVMNHVREIQFPSAIGDPNMAIIYRDFDPASGDYSRPTPTLYEAERVLWYVPGEEMCVQMIEPSEVIVGRRTVKEGIRLLFVTPLRTVMVFQVGEKKDMNFEAVELENREAFPYMPARLLKGQAATNENGELLWESWVAGIIPDWNKAIQRISDLDGHIITHLYPKYAQLSLPCNTCHGSGEVQIDVNPRTGKPERGKCPSCKGTAIQGGGGGPFAALTIPPDKIGTIAVSDVAGYISPGTDIITAAKELIDAHIDAGFRALNMEVVGVTQSNVTAEKIALDRQDLNQTLTDISNWAFELALWNFEIAARIRYGGIVGQESITEKVVPDIQRPVSFDYSTIDTIIQELKAAEEAKLPPNFVAQLQKRAAKVIFGNDTETTRRILTEQELDPLPGITPDGVLALQATGMVDPFDFFIHYKIQTILDIAVERNPQFYELPLFAKRAGVLKIAQELSPAGKLEPGSDAALIEAQAKLKGTVGGVQGIIELNRAVNSGETSEQAAEAILVSVYGFDLETARTLIEKGKSIPKPAEPNPTA